MAKEALTRKRDLCYKNAMSETLTIRLPAEEKAQWAKAAAEVSESVAEYVRKSVRQRAPASLDAHSDQFGHLFRF